VRIDFECGLVPFAAFGGRPIAIFIVDPTTDGLAWFCANIADHQVNLGRARRSSLLTGLASYAPAEILKGKP
jgi:hypothetical protein